MAHLLTMLIEQFLFGMGSLENYIIAEEPASFSAAYDIAHALEATSKTTSEVKNAAPTGAEQINKLGYAPPELKNKRSKKNYHKLTQKLTSSSDSGDQGHGNYRMCQGCGGGHA